MNLRELIENSFTKFKNNIAIEYIDDYGKLIPISYRRYYDDVKSISKYLINYTNSINKNNLKVGIIGENSYSWLSVYVAAIYSGFTAIPIDKNIEEIKLKNIIDESDLDILFVGNQYENKLANNHGIIANGKKISEKKLHSEILNINISNNIVEESKNNQCNDVASILYTSGTTGEIKGVMLTQDNLMSNCCALTMALSLPKGKKLFNILPFHHAFSSMCDILFSLYNGHTLSIGTSIKYIEKELKFFKPHYIYLVPMIAEFIYTEIKKGAMDKELITLEDFSKSFLGGSIEYVFCGGAQITTKLIDNYRELGIKFLRGYGITECSPVIALTAPRKEYSDLSVGHPIDCNIIKIVDGEILVKGSNVMKGYLNNDSATNEVFDEGWFRTGDLGKYEGETLYITGRKKSTIILPNGKNVYPEEIERQLKDNKSISECIVFLDTNNKGKVCLSALIIIDEVFQKLNSKNDLVTIDNIFSNYNESVPLYKSIRNYYIVDSEWLIRTSTNKVKRGNEQNLKRKSLILKTTVEAISSRMLDDVKVDINTSIIEELGFDSFEMFSLACELEVLFDIKIVDTDLEYFRSVKDIFDYIYERNPTLLNV